MHADTQAVEDDESSRESDVQMKMHRRPSSHTVVKCLLARFLRSSISLIVVWLICTSPSSPTGCPLLDLVTCYRFRSHYVKTTHFGNAHRWPLVTGRASITDQVLQKWAKKGNRLMPLITHIRNGHQTTIVTTTSHRSHEMTVSLGPQRTLITSIKAEPVTWTQHWRRILWACVSSVSTKGDACCVRVSPISRLKETCVVYARLLCRN
jgi:hypothetical protein